MSFQNPFPLTIVQNHKNESDGESGVIINLKRIVLSRWDNYFDKTFWVKMRPEAHPGKKSPTDLPINVQLVKNRLVLICGT